MDSFKKMFELLNRISGHPSKSNFKLDSKIKHKESINVVLTSHDPNGTEIRSETPWDKKN